ncbi:lysophospholipid acyltransferase family protein [Candidatus Latescibacterota bacterium]
MELFAKPVSRLVLKICGIKVQVSCSYQLPQKQAIYIFNHTSTLDLIIVSALGLPHIRFFLSKKTRKFLPITVIATMIGTFYTPPQSKPAERIACFQRAEKILRKTGDSVLLSPEGTRITNGEIGKFNKGAFHLATNLKWTLYPIYIDITKDINPNKGYKFNAGTVKIFFLPKIETDRWELRSLNTNIKQVRNIFSDFHNDLHDRDIVSRT